MKVHEYMYIIFSADIHQEIILYFSGGIFFCKDGKLSLVTVPPDEVSPLSGSDDSEDDAFFPFPLFFPFTVFPLPVSESIVH